MLIKKNAPGFQGFAKGVTAHCPLPIDNRVYAGVIVKAIGTGPAAAVIDIRNVATQVRVMRNDKALLVIDPVLQRICDSIQNATSDTLATDKLLIPFYRQGIPGSVLRVGDANSLRIEVDTVSEANFPDDTVLTNYTAKMGYLPAVPTPTGLTYVQAIQQQSSVNAGLNTVDVFPVGNVRQLTKLILNHAGVVNVRLVIDDVEVYNLDRDEAQFMLQENPVYKDPANNADLPFFPVILDDLWHQADFPLIGDKSTVKLEYTIDADEAAAAPFRILVEGLADMSAVA